MFGAVVRVAVGWAGSMLLISVLAAVVEPHVLPRLQSGSLLYRSLDGTITYLPLIVTVAAVLMLVGRGLAEREAV